MTTISLLSPRAKVGTARLILFALCFLLSHTCLAQARDLVYTVKRGDTLSGLADKYDVTVSVLASRNGLKPTSTLITGQRLRVPAKKTDASAKGPTLPTNIAKAIADAPVKPGRWKRIVIHHSATSQATIKGMTDHHARVRHMENGLAYHFVIGNGHGMEDGAIYAGNRWISQLDGGHLASEAQNQVSLGICLVGNFDAEAPTAKQMQSLTALVKALQKRCKLNNRAVVTHQQINVLPTRCPGRFFPIKTLYRNLDVSK